MNKQNHFDVWDYYFSSGYSYEDYEILRLHALHECTQFMRGVNDGYIRINDDPYSPVSHNPVLDEWVAKNHVMLAALVQDIQAHILSVVRFALPAHDERQILKDAAEGLRYYAIEKPQGYKSTFVIPMMCHDIGRLWEGRLYDPVHNPHDNWIPHSQLSFLMLKDILSQKQYRDMPQELKNHFLYALLAHSGDNGLSYMSRAVQTCDRMQLIGAEGVFRATSYGVCLMRGNIGYPHDPSYEFELPSRLDDHHSALSLLEYCGRYMRENIGAEHQSWQRRIAVENVALLKAACVGNPEMANRMFAPELGHSSMKKKIDAQIFEDGERLYQKSKGTFGPISSVYEVATALIASIQEPLGAGKKSGAAQLSDDMKRAIHRSVGMMPQSERASFYQMICIGDVFRAEQEGMDRALCRKLTNGTFPAFVSAIAQMALRYADEAPAVDRPLSPAFTGNALSIASPSPI